MTRVLIFVGIFAFLLLQDMGTVKSSTLQCNEKNEIKDLAGSDQHGDENKYSLNTLFRNIHCTLEKAKPWWAELQHEAKRLEEAARVLGLDIMKSFGNFIDKLVEETSGTPPNAQNSNKTKEKEDSNNSTKLVNVNEETAQNLCPDGFAVDHNGVCGNEFIKSIPVLPA